MWWAYTPTASLWAFWSCIMSPMVSTTALTDREYEVLGLIASGMRNKDVAHHLSIAEKTVKNHVGNILKSLGVNSRTMAVVWYLKQSGPGSDTATGQ